VRHNQSQRIMIIYLYLRWAYIPYGDILVYV